MKKLFNKNKPQFVFWVLFGFVVLTTSIAVVSTQLTRSDKKAEIPSGVYEYTISPEDVESLRPIVAVSGRFLRLSGNQMEIETSEGVKTFNVSEGVSLNRDGSLIQGSLQEIALNQEISVVYNSNDNQVISVWYGNKEGQPSNGSSSSTLSQIEEGGEVLGVRTGPIFLSSLASQNKSFFIPYRDYPLRSSRTPVGSVSQKALPWLGQTTTIALANDGDISGDNFLLSGDYSTRYLDGGPGSWLSQDFQSFALPGILSWGAAAQTRLGAEACPRTVAIDVLDRNTNACVPTIPGPQIWSSVTRSLGDHSAGVNGVFADVGWPDFEPHLIGTAPNASMIGLFSSGTTLFRNEFVLTEEEVNRITHMDITFSADDFARVLINGSPVVASTLATDGELSARVNASPVNPFRVGNNVLAFQVNDKARWDISDMVTGTTDSNGAGLWYNASIVLSPPPAEYTITYSSLNATSGTPPAAVTLTSGANHTVANQGTLARIGHTFGGWNFGGTILAPGQVFSNVTASITANPHWIPITHTITYSSLNATSGTPPAAVNVTHGHTHVVAGPGTLVRTGHTFGGWDFGGTIYTAGSVVPSIVSSMTANPHWVPITATHTITYTALGSTSGTAPAPAIVNNGASVVVAGPGTLVRTDHTFGGWNFGAPHGVVQPGVSLHNVTASMTANPHWVPVTPTACTVNRFNATPLTGGSPLNVSFDFAVTGATSWSINFGNGMTSANNPHSPLVFNYANPGSFTATITCNPGAVQRSQVITVTGNNRAPQLILESPNNNQIFNLGTSPTAFVSLNARATDPDNDNVAIFIGIQKQSPEGWWGRSWNFLQDTRDAWVFLSPTPSVNFEHNLEAGRYRWYAFAADNRGAITVSSVRFFEVTSVSGTQAPVTPPSVTQPPLQLSCAVLPNQITSGSVATIRLENAPQGARFIYRTGQTVLANTTATSVSVSAAQFSSGVNAVTVAVEGNPSLVASCNVTLTTTPGGGGTEVRP